MQKQRPHGKKIGPFPLRRPRRDFHRQAKEDEMRRLRTNLRPPIRAFEAEGEGKQGDREADSFGIDGSQRDLQIRREEGEDDADDRHERLRSILLGPEEGAPEDSVHRRMLRERAIQRAVLPRSPRLRDEKGRRRARGKGFGEVFQIPILNPGKREGVGGFRLHRHVGALPRRRRALAPERNRLRRFLPRHGEPRSRRGPRPMPRHEGLGRRKRRALPSEEIRPFDLFDARIPVGKENQSRQIPRLAQRLRAQGAAPEDRPAIEDRLRFLPFVPKVQFVGPDPGIRGEEARRVAKGRDGRVRSGARLLPVDPGALEGMDRQFVRQGERAQDKQRPDRGHEQPAEEGDEGRRRRHFVPALPSEDNVRLQQGDFDVAVEKHQGHGEEKG